MTNTDNKDPQITPEMVQEVPMTQMNLNADIVDMDCRAAFEKHYMGYYFKRAANGEYISEETRKLWNCWWCSWDAATPQQIDGKKEMPHIICEFKRSLDALALELPESVWNHHKQLAEQLTTELQQLRAERAGLLEWVNREMINNVHGYELWILEKLKSRLTDSAQRSVTKEESDILKQALIDSSETVHEGKLEQPPQPAEGEPEQKEGESWQDMKRMKVSDGGTVLLKQPRKEHEGE